MQAPTVGPDLLLQPLAKRLGVLMAASAHHSHESIPAPDGNEDAAESFTHNDLQRGSDIGYTRGRRARSKLSASAASVRIGSEPKTLVWPGRVISLSASF